MSDLFAARLTMGLSLGFHIILAATGMVMPLLMSLAHRRWLKTGDDVAYRLTRASARGVAIFFATGAVSGTALAFELGVLWPNFMKHAGPIIGLPFSFEGIAFFVEAIVFGIYAYGLGKIPVKIHWYMGVLVGIAGLSSGALIIAANAWMNSPSGFTWTGSEAINIDPWAAFFNPAWASQAGHMLIAAVGAVAFAVAGTHAILILRGDQDPIHVLALRIALSVAAVAALAQPLHGHYTAQNLAGRQELKLAALEAHFDTMPQAPLTIGGIPDLETQTVKWALQIPSGLSVLAFNSPSATVKGLNDFPRDEWPPVLIVHFAFQIMVAIGGFLALVSLLYLFCRWRKPQWLLHRRFLWVIAFCLPLGFVAIEAGWIVTEVGRQPWLIYGIMRTAEGLTPVPGQVFHLIVFMSLYALIGFSTIWMWRIQIRHAQKIPGPSPEITAWATGNKIAEDEQP
jgi:cytochrome d ubiquinol oxidase subunit I